MRAVTCPFTPLFSSRSIVGPHDLLIRLDSQDLTNASRAVIPERTNFPTTQWSAVVDAARSADQLKRHEALTHLCRDYWYPLYAFARKAGHGQEDAEDLTQGFFGYMLERNVLDSANRELGTLRTFLLRVFQRYAGDVRDRAQAQKRGGGIEILPLNVSEGEESYSRDAAIVDTPEKLFDRSWAHAVLRGALWQLGESEREACRESQFAILEPFLNPDTEGAYDSAATALGMSLESTRQTVSRLRKKFRDCLRERIAATLQEPDAARVDEELTALKAALR